MYGLTDFSNFGSLKSTETGIKEHHIVVIEHFSNFGSLKSTETYAIVELLRVREDISAISAR